MKNIDQLADLSGNTGNSNKRTNSEVTDLDYLPPREIRLSKIYGEINLKLLVNSGHLITNILVEANDGDLASIAYAPVVNFKEIEIPTSPSLRDKFLAKWSKKAQDNAKKGLGYSLLLLPLTACGGSEDGQPVSVSVGRVIDGYINNAFVFRDENDNGIFDSDEPNTLTDINGRFSLDGNLEKQIIVDGSVDGAIDMASGEAFTSVLTAPVGSTVITPVTTLIQHLIDDGLTAVAAEDAVKVGLGLDPATDLTTTDPIASSNTDLYVAGVSVATIMESAGGGANGEEASIALAAAFKETESEIDLADVDAVIDILATTSIEGIDTIAAKVSSQAAVLATATSVSDVSDVQAQTFIVTDTSDVISFSGTATGSIVLTANSTGGASFSRAGVNGADSSGDIAVITNLNEKEIDFTGELTAVVTDASTAGDDSFILNAPDATKITLRGSLGDGSNEVRITIADDTPGEVDTRSLELLSDGFTVGANDRLVFDFASEEDEVALTVDSTISQFGIIEVAKGTLDLRAVAISDDVEFIVNSGLTLTQSQFLSIESIVSVSGLGELNLTLDAGQTLETLATSVSELTDFVIVGTDLTIKDSDGADLLVTADGVASTGAIPNALEAVSYKGIPELTEHITTSLAALESQIEGTATEPFDTLGEIQSYIENLDSLISKLTTLIGDADGELASTETALVARLDIIESSIAGDVAAPTLSSIAISSADGSVLDVGDAITVSATFDSSVIISGSPTVNILIGSTTQTATYSSGAGTNVLKFNYTIQSSDTADVDGISIPSNAIQIPSNASITDIAGNAYAS
ncbi:hypothetical protein N9D98_09010, partial [Amylibacter sp.]|nr:hypothetical protein [Amylibacter sp.]